MTSMTRAAVLAATLAASLGGLPSGGRAASPDAKAVIATYEAIAEAMYQDAHAGAVALQQAVDALVKGPTESTLKAARKAWIDARPAYQQTEGLRFGNAIVDDWEGRVNAWPLDEGLIDYVDAGYGSEAEHNPLYTANVIANRKIRVGATMVDASTIDKKLIASLHEAQEVEANVSIGYHAVEFLLWGQDLNGTGPGAGNRPHTDFDPKNCTNGDCERRAAYLVAATDLLVDDLAEMVANWAPGGAARKDLEGKGSQGALATILTGLGSLSYGELGGERMKLGLILHDPEEEHDCFSDNTHNSHYYDQVGMQALATGRYVRTSGKAVEGPGILDLAAAKDKAVAGELRKALETTTARMQVMKDAADSGRMAYDQMIGEGNDAGNRIVQDAIDALVAQTRAIERVVAALDLTIQIEGSDSLDNPAAVGKN
ncbi:MAG: imelysin family protein [Thalassobaculum sp.]|uniref:imelysin family protein n=1 Tax=Thalassobaculum sp. TaxID=2022740 RepID=UPI0032EE9C3F